MRGISRLLFVFVVEKVLGPTVLGPTGCFVDKKAFNSVFFLHSCRIKSNIYIYIYIYIIIIIPVQTMKAYRESRGIAPPILNLGTRPRWVVNHTLWYLHCCGNIHRYPCNGVRGGAIGWGTALQAGRSGVGFSMVSLENFIDIILPTALCPWGWLSL